MEKTLVNDLQKELHLKTTELFYTNVFLKSSECFMDLFLINIEEGKKTNSKSDKYYIIKITMMIMIMIIINNNSKNNTLTFGSPRDT